MKLNCDVGETDYITPESVEYQVIPYIDMISIACGFHAGNEQVMQDCIRLAKDFKVEVGAHPGYPDKENFGRVSMELNHVEIINVIGKQLKHIKAIAHNLNCYLQYVKPHGALYNDMMCDDLVFDSVVEGMCIYGAGLPLVIMAASGNTRLQEKAESKGVKLIQEAFADRRYTDQGLLQSRQIIGSVFDLDHNIIEQTQNIKDGFVKTDTGKILFVESDTICIHGDNPASVAAVAKLKKILLR